MVSSGQQLFQEMWAKNKDALTVMCLEELAGADVSMNVRWEGSPDVVVGTVLESEFSLPTRRDMTKKRARSSPEADAVLKHGAWKIILQETSSTSGSPGASQAGLQGLTPSRKHHQLHQHRRSSDGRPRPIGMAPSPPRDAPSRSRSLRIYGDNAHRAPAARRDVRNAPAPQILQAVPKRCITRYRLQPALQAGAVKPCEDTPASWRRLTMS